MFQAWFGKVDVFGWWDLERIQTESGTQFTSKEFQEGLSISGVQIKLAAPDHQKSNGLVEVMWQTLRIITHSIMVHIRVFGKYINFALMYITNHIFPILPIKNFTNQDNEHTKPHELAPGNDTKPLVSNIRVLSCTSVFYKKWLHMLTERCSTCIINHKRVFGVLLLGFYYTKKGTSSTYLWHKR